MLNSSTRYILSERTYAPQSRILCGSTSAHAGTAAHSLAKGFGYHMRSTVAAGVLSIRGD